jgi:fermentation-respiration switch protein FrsA (DUF1100 family)
MWWWLLVPVVALAGTAAVLALYPPTPRDLGGARDLDPEAARVRVPLGDDADAVDGWYLPGTRPAALLLLHGYGRTHHRMWRYAASLRAAGYHLLAIDFRSARARDRKPTTLGVHELEDARAALEWLRAQPALAGARIGVFGESLGGAVALLLAGRDPAVHAAAVDCAFAHSRLAVEDYLVRLMGLPRWPTAPLVRGLGRVWTGCDPCALDIAAAAAALRDRPVLFVQGLTDNRLSDRHVRLLWQAAGGKDPLWLVPDAGHNQSWLRHRQEYERRLVEFFEDALIGALASKARA